MTVWTRWLPWRFVIRRLARAHGFLDPLALIAQLRRFAQPSEVGEPVELLRAGMVFHARGLINSRVLQHNLDWVWPYRVQRQFDPKDDAFVPRAFSITHVNLTHRNWTAIGVPDCEALPIVDPRGLLTPHSRQLVAGWLGARRRRPHPAALARACGDSNMWKLSTDRILSPRPAERPHADQPRLGRNRSGTPVCTPVAECHVQTRHAWWVSGACGHRTPKA